MPVFKQCCCCLSLYTGGVILGVLGAIRSLIGIILSAFALIYIDELVHEGKARSQSMISEHRDNFSNFVINNGTLSNDEDSEEATELAILLIKIILCIYLVVSVVDFCSAILLIIGSKRLRKEFILPYLVTDGLGIVISTVFFLTLAFTGPNMAQGLLSAILGLLVSGYFWLCVLSLYQHIKEQSRAPAVIRTNYPEQQAVYSTMT